MRKIYTAQRDNIFLKNCLIEFFEFTSASLHEHFKIAHGKKIYYTTPAE